MYALFRKQLIPPQLTSKKYWIARQESLPRKVFLRSGFSDSFALCSRNTLLFSAVYERVNSIETSQCLHSLYTV